MGISTKRATILIFILGAIFFWAPNRCYALRGGGGGGSFTGGTVPNPITANVNGVLNAKAPPYSAKGDGSTDDAAAIQAAYNAAAAYQNSNGNGSAPEMYLPATPNSCYSLSKPLIFNNTVNVRGAGASSTHLCPQFWGPDVIQQWNSGYLAPLTANVTAAWQASHAYSTAYTEVADPNGKIEYVSTTGTSGASAPSWCTTGLGCTTSDGTVTWTQGPATSGGGLLTGTGSAWDASSTANQFSTIFQGLDLDWDPAVNLNGLGALTIEFVVDPIYVNTYNYNDALFCARPAKPESSNAPAACITVGGGGSNYIYGSLDIAGSSVSVSSSTALPLNQLDDLALSYDGSTVRLYLNGAMIGSTAATGTITEPFYEHTLYPGGDTVSQNVAPGGYYGSLRISSIARYTGSSYTPATAQFTSDSNTLVLVNFPKPPTVGSGEAGYIQAANSTIPVFLPLESSQSHQIGGHLSGIDMDVPTNGGWNGGCLYATWVIDAVWDDLSCDAAPYIGLDLYDNDYQDTVRNVFVNVNDAGSKAAQTPINFYFGNASNNNIYENLQADGGARTSYFESGGYATYINDKMTGRGYSVYPIVNDGGAGTYIAPFEDIEGTESSNLSDFYEGGVWAPVTIEAPEFLSGNSSASCITVSGGAGLLVAGGTCSGTFAQEVDILSAPTIPVSLRNVAFSSGYTLTNTGTDVTLDLGGVLSRASRTFDSAVNFGSASSITGGVPGTPTVGAATRATSLGTTATPALPAGVSSGDLLLNINGIDNASASNITTAGSCASGWTATATANDSTDGTVAIWGCTEVAGSSPTAPTVTWTDSAYYHGIVLDLGPATLVSSAGSETTTNTGDSLSVAATPDTDSLSLVLNAVDIAAGGGYGDVVFPSGDSVLTNAQYYSGFGIASYVGPSVAQTVSWSPTNPSTIAALQLAFSLKASDAPAFSMAGNGILGTLKLEVTPFADLPATVVNGESLYCPDCDPPANPPVACTSSGSKTGSFVHGDNGSWICVP